jgi:3-methyladenine DNA glycosylase AlkD
MLGNKISNNIKKSSYTERDKLTSLRKELNDEADPEKAKELQRFFKTGKGQYGHGDVFIGIKVPVLRKIAKKNNDICMSDVIVLLRSRIHEERLIALIILVSWFEKKDEGTKEKIFSIYMDNTESINNWDLVDISAPRIVGAFLVNKKRDILYSMAASESLWEKRISIIATLYFIKKGQYKDTLKISRMLITEEHDLIHKAVGWMLREVGKNCSKEILTGFLKRYYKKMPRTMLRYSIERFPPEVRKKYLNGLV